MRKPMVLLLWCCGMISFISSLGAVALDPSRVTLEASHQVGLVRATWQDGPTVHSGPVEVAGFERGFSDDKEMLTRMSGIRFTKEIIDAHLTIHVSQNNAFFPTTLNLYQQNVIPQDSFDINNVSYSTFSQGQIAPMAWSDLMGSVLLEPNFQGELVIRSEALTQAVIAANASNQPLDLILTGNFFSTNLGITLGQPTQLHLTFAEEPPPAPSCVDSSSLELYRWWAFDDQTGTQASELVVQDHGSLVNGPTPISEGQVDGALSFDGIDDVVQVAANPQLDIVQDEFTIETWIRPEGSGTLVSQYDFGAHRGVEVVLQSSPVPGTLDVSLFLNGIFYPSICPVPQNEWSHLAIAMGTEGGICSTGLSSSYPIPAFRYIVGFREESTPLLIGNTPFVWGAYQGQMDELSLYSRPLSRSEIDAIIVAGSEGKCKPSSIARGGEVHGRVLSNFDGNQMAIPGITVRMTNLESNSVSETTSDERGLFIFPSHPQGTYSLCWEGQGWPGECLAELINLEAHTEYPQIRVSPDLDGKRLIRGKVTLADGSLAYFQNTFFGINDFATIIGRDSNGQTFNTVRINAHGEYVLTEVPNAPVQLEISYANNTEIIFNNDSSELISTTDVSFNNTPPRVKWVMAGSAGDIIRQVPVGTPEVPILSDISDADGDALIFTWKDITGNSPVSAASANPTWFLPNRAVKRRLYLLVSDTRGGYATGHVDMSIGRVEDRFGGTVVDFQENPLSGVTIEVNGVSATTNAEGRFSFRVPPEKRYVFSASKDGFLTTSRVYPSEVRSGHWKLARSHQILVDPTQLIVVEDTSSEWVVSGRTGAQITVPANSLVDANGVLATQPLTLSMNTLDPDDRNFPGDFGAINLRGQRVNLISYGAADIEFHDSSGQVYNLAPGKTATLKIPIPPRISHEHYPSNFPLWVYNYDDATWYEEAVQGRLIINPASDVAMVEYVLSHFSTFNIDVEAPGPPACTRVVVDTASLPLGLELRVDVIFDGGNEQKQGFFLADQINMLYNLPLNAQLVLEVLNEDDVVIASAFVEDTGGEVVAPENPEDLFPYTDCESEAFLTTEDIDAPEASTENMFTRKLVNTADIQSAEAYYGFIDKDDLRTNLGDWWVQNGFFDSLADIGNVPPAGLHTVFFNGNDLGFGRDMHCLKQSEENFACYVSNYDDEEEALDGGVSPATVAMEYSVVEGQESEGPVMKFFIYEGDNAGSLRNGLVDLGLGPQAAPNLCLICHGGDYNPVFLEDEEDEIEFNQIAEMKKSVLREFDLRTYEYPIALPRSDQEPVFKDMNLEVVSSSAEAAATASGEFLEGSSLMRLLEAFYDGGNSDTQIDDAVPEGWTDTPPADLYHQVVGRSCRTCHTAFNGSLGFKEYDDFKNFRASIYYDVCNAHEMPHAPVTFNNFWSTDEIPDQPDFLMNFEGPFWQDLLTDPNVGGPCPAEE